MSFLRRPFRMIVGSLALTSALWLSGCSSASPNNAGSGGNGGWSANGGVSGSMAHAGQADSNGGQAGSSGTTPAGGAGGTGNTGQAGAGGSNSMGGLPNAGAGGVNSAGGSANAGQAGAGGANSDVEASVLGLSFGIKQLQFHWTAALGAKFYRLYADPDGTQGFQQIGGDRVELSATLDIAVHEYNWPLSRYRVDACNDFVCKASNIIDINDMSATIGYVKASNTARVTGPKLPSYFGFSLALSGDGNHVGCRCLRRD